MPIGELALVVRDAAENLSDLGRVGCGRRRLTFDRRFDFGRWSRGHGRRRMPATGEPGCGKTHDGRETQSLCESVHRGPVDER